MSACAFLTNHALVLLCVAREPGARLRDIAEWLDITERAAHRIVDDLVMQGYLTRHRMGRRSFYEVHPERPLGAPLVAEIEVGRLLDVLLEEMRAEKEGGTLKAVDAEALPPRR